jgi:ketol-acid reductoisomerase
VFEDLYRRVKTGAETRRVLQACGGKNYQQALEKELAAIGNSEMWQAGRAVRTLRPAASGKKVIAVSAKGVGGRTSN